MRKFTRGEFLTGLAGIGGGLLIKPDRAQAAGASLDQTEVDKLRKLLQPGAYDRLIAMAYLADGIANPRVITEKTVEIARSTDSLAYPALQMPDPTRELVFPDVKKGDRSPLAAFEQPFSNGDYFHAGFGEVDVPQYYYRLITGRTIMVPELGLNVKSAGRKGALVLLINHFGETAAYRSCVAENCYTVAGRVFDMSSPEKVGQVSQALLDHQLGRMTNSADGANCSVIDACNSVEWHTVVIGNGKSQLHQAGLYTKGG